MRAKVGVYASQQVLKQKELLIWVVYEKSTHVVVKFRAYKSLGMQFHEKCFSIQSRTYSNEMRARVGVYASQQVLKQEEFLIWVVYEKSTHVVVKFRAYKSLGMQFHEKCFSIQSRTYSNEMRAKVGVYESQQVLKQKELLIWVVYEKSTHVVVKFCAQKSVGVEFHEKCFSIQSRTCSNEMRARVGVYASQQVLKQEEFLIWVVYEKSTHVVVKFRAYKSLGMQFHEKCFSIQSRTYSNEMRAKVGVYASQQVLKQKELLIWVVYEKSTHVVVKFRAYKSLGMQFHEKCFSIQSRTYSNEMRAKQECMNPSRC